MKKPIFSAQLSIKSFPWLGYSAKFDVCLYLPCALFSSRSHSKYFVQKVYSHLTKLNEEGHFLKKTQHDHFYVDLIVKCYTKCEE